MTDIGWYFTVTSEKYGSADYGPYDSEREALQGIARIKIAARDGVEREYSWPKQREDN